MTEYLEWKNLREQIRQELTTDLTHGRHFSVIAPTGGGKTTLTTKGIIPMFEGVADILLIDSTADPKLAKYGKPFHRFGKIDGIRRLTVNDHSPDSAERIKKALQKAYKQGEVVTVLDEVRHITDSKYLGLAGQAEFAWLFSRKRRNLMGGLTQAPRYVPSAFYDQSKLHFIFRIRDRRAMLRLAEIGGDYDTLKKVVPQLAEYEFAFVNAAGDVIVSKFDIKASQNQPKERRVMLQPSARPRKIQVVR